MNSEANLTVLLDSDDPAAALRALGAPVDREWGRDSEGNSGFELSSEGTDRLIQRLRPIAPALRGISRHPATRSIRITVPDHASLDNAAISLLAAIGADLYVE
jgi:hypothetical protein